MYPSRLFLVAMFVASAIGMTGFFVVIDYLDSRSETSRMVAIADQFAADPAWTLTEERIAGQEVYRCREQNGCSEVHRVWSSRPELTPGDLQEVIEKSGWTLDAKDPYVAEGVIDGYEITVSLYADGHRPDEIDLFMSKVK